MVGSGSQGSSPSAGTDAIIDGARGMVNIGILAENKESCRADKLELEQLSWKAYNTANRQAMACQAQSFGNSRRTRYAAASRALVPALRRDWIPRHSEQVRENVQEMPDCTAWSESNGVVVEDRQNKEHVVHDRFRAAARRCRSPFLTGLWCLCAERPMLYGSQRDYHCTEKNASSRYSRSTNPDEEMVDLDVGGGRGWGCI